MSSFHGSTHFWAPADALAAPEREVQRIVWAVAGVFVAASIVVSALLIRGHLQHFTQPNVQSKIVGILWMVPIYATDSWLSLRFKDAALYLDLMRDSYEGYVIYLFLALLIAYLSQGSKERMVAMVKPLPDLDHPWPVNTWAKPIQLGPTFLRDCKMATMQFVVVKPTMALVAIVLHLNGLYDPGDFRATRGYLYTSFVVNASITYAFYYLVLFYKALRSPLAPFHPMPKFLCIKAVLFLSFWQSLVLAFLSRFEVLHDVGSWSVENVTTGIQNLLICFEMFGVALAHHRAFPYDLYVHGNAALRTNILADHLAFEDAVRDFNEVMPVVLPTSFKPGAATMVTKTKYKAAQVTEKLQSETKRLLSDVGATSDVESEAFDDSRSSASAARKGPARGWRL